MRSVRQKSRERKYLEKGPANNYRSGRSCEQGIWGNPEAVEGAEARRGVGETGRHMRAHGRRWGLLP